MFIIIINMLKGQIALKRSAINSINSQVIIGIVELFKEQLLVTTITPRRSGAWQSWQIKFFPLSKNSEQHNPSMPEKS